MPLFVFVVGLTLLIIYAPQGSLRPFSMSQNFQKLPVAFSKLGAWSCNRAALEILAPLPPASTVRNRQRLQPFPYWLPSCPVRPPIPRDNLQHLHGNKRPQNAPFHIENGNRSGPFYMPLLIPEIRLFTVARNSTFPVR